MKKNIAIILATFVFISAFAGCSQPAAAPSSSSAAASSTTAVASSSTKAEEDLSKTFKTLADVIKVRDKERWSYSYDEKKICYVFEAEGVVYRAYATMKKDVFDNLQELVTSPEESLEKREQAISVLTVDRCENLSLKILKQEELDKFIGKTGKDLFDEGWEPRGFSLEDPEGMQLYAAKGMFEYTVIFEDKYDGKPINWDSDEFDEMKYFSDKKIKAVKYMGVSDAALSLD